MCHPKIKCTCVPMYLYVYTVPEGGVLQKSTLLSNLQITTLYYYYSSTTNRTGTLQSSKHSGQFK